MFQLMKTNFVEMDLISALAFLKEARAFCDDISIYKGASLRTVLYFMKKSASSSLEGRLSPKKIRATRLHEERLSSYVEGVNYLLSI